MLALMNLAGDMLWWLLNHLPVIKNLFYWFYYESPEVLFVPIYRMWRLITLCFRII